MHTVAFSIRRCGNTPVNLYHRISFLAGYFCRIPGRLHLKCNTCHRAGQYFNQNFGHKTKKKIPTQTAAVILTGFTEKHETERDLQSHQTESTAITGNMAYNPPQKVTKRSSKTALCTTKSQNHGFH